MAIVVNPIQNPWNQMPDALDRLVGGVSALRNKLMLPKDLQALAQIAPEAATGNIDFSQLIGQMKSDVGRQMVVNLWMKQMESKRMVPVYDQSNKFMGYRPANAVTAKNEMIPIYKGGQLMGYSSQRPYEMKEEKPVTRTIQRGTESVTQEYNQQTKSWEDVSRGPKWQPPELTKPTLLQNERGELVPWRPGMPTEGLSKPTVSSLSDQNMQTIVQGLKDGTIAPSMLSKRATDYNKILAYAQKSGVNMTQLDREQRTALNWAKSLSNPQMARFEGLAISVVNTAERLKQTAGQLKLSGMTLLNRANLYQAIHLRGNSPQGKLAGQYITDMNSLKEEMANLVQGGYAPTEPAFALVNRQLREEYGGELTISNVNEMQRLIRYRFGAFETLREQRAGLKPGKQMWPQEGKNGKPDYYNTFKQALSGPMRQQAIDFARQNNPDFIDRAKQEGLLQ